MIEELTVENLGCFDHGPHTARFTKETVLVGPNNSGKSMFLSGINFLRHTSLSNRVPWSTDSYNLLSFENAIHNHDKSETISIVALIDGKTFVLKIRDGPFDFALDGISGFTQKSIDILSNIWFIQPNRTSIPPYASIGTSGTPLQPIWPNGQNITQFLLEQFAAQHPLWNEAAAWLRARAHQEALTVRTKEAIPEKYAETQYNMGNVYVKFAKVREPEENLGIAIKAYQEALTVRTKESSPINYAATQNNIGNAYLKFAGVREPEENLGIAIKAYQEALKIRTKEAFSKDYALTQYNMGNAYSTLAEVREPEKNLRSAIKVYQEALIIFSKEAFPNDYAATQNNMGNAYRNLADVRERKENLRLAIQAYQEALKIRTKEAFPLYNAITQYNIGTSYRNLARAINPEENSELTIKAYMEALSILIRFPHPELHKRITHDLALAIQDMGRLRPR